MMRIIKKIVVPLLGVLCLCFLLACNNDKAIPIGSDLVGSDDLSKVLQTTKPAVTDSAAGKIVNTYLSSFLLLGTLKDLECRILLRFDPLPDTGVVAAAKLKLPADTLSGQTGNFEATVHQITSPWKESEVVWGDKNFPVAFNAAEMDKQRISAPKPDTVVFNLPPATAASWFSARGAQRDSLGVMIQARGATFLKELHSRLSSTKQPFLELTTKRTGRSDTTVRRTATASVFVFRRMAPLALDRVYVGNGEKILSSVFFNLSAARPDTIPANATISRALLTLDVDAANSVFVDNASLVSFSLFRTQKKFGLDTLKANADSLFFIQQASALATDASVQINVTGLVQSWVTNPPQDYGYLVLFPNFPEGSLNRAAFFSRKTDVARGPRLRIDYTTPPK